MPAEYTILARERRRAIRQKTSENKRSPEFKQLVQQTECARIQHNERLSTKDRIQFEKNQRTDLAIMAGIFARLRIPCSVPHEQARPLEQEPFEDEILEEESFHMSIRRLDNPVDDICDLPSDEEDLDAQEWLVESFQDLDTTNGNHLPQPEDTPDVLTHQESNQAFVPFPSCLQPELQQLTHDERQFVTDCVVTKDIVNGFCFPERHPDYGRFITLLDQFPSKSVRCQQFLLGLGIKTCGDFRNSAWSRLILYNKTGVRLRQFYRTMLLYEEPGTLVHLCILRLLARVKMKILSIYPGASDTDVSRIVFGRITPPPFWRDALE